MMDEHSSEGQLMTWSAGDIPDQTGRLAVVTGANGGLGLETTRALAQHGAHVIIAARNLGKAETANQDILAVTPGASLEVRPLDLASLDSVRRFATDVTTDHEVIDILVNNAGVMAPPYRETVDGFELQFGTNHLGHFALTALLMPALLRSKRARVVTVTSTGRHFGGELYPPRWVNFGAPVRRPILAGSRKPEDLRALWALSERDTGMAFDVEALAKRSP